MQNGLFSAQMKLIKRYKKYHEEIKWKQNLKIIFNTWLLTPGLLLLESTTTPITGEFNKFNKRGGDCGGGYISFEGLGEHFIEGVFIVLDFIGLWLSSSESTSCMPSFVIISSNRWACDVFACDVPLVDFYFRNRWENFRNRF